MKEKSTLPIITKPTQVRELSEYAREVFELEAAADDFYCLGYDNKAQRLPGSIWRISPFVKKL